MIRKKELLTNNGVMDLVNLAKFTYKTEGIKGMFRGVSISIIRNILYYGIFFVTLKEL